MLGYSCLNAGMLHGIEVALLQVWRKLFYNADMNGMKKECGHNEAWSEDDWSVVQHCCIQPKGSIIMFTLQVNRYGFLDLTEQKLVA